MSCVFLLLTIEIIIIDQDLPQGRQDHFLRGGGGGGGPPCTPPSPQKTNLKALVEGLGNLASIVVNYKGGNSVNLGYYSLGDTGIKILMQSPGPDNAY